MEHPGLITLRELVSQAYLRRSIVQDLCEMSNTQDEISFDDVINIFESERLKHPSYPQALQIAEFINSI